MKKLIITALCLCLGFSAFAGEKFENIVGAGLTLPVSSTKYKADNKDDDTRAQIGLGADLFWVGIMKDLGLAFKADFAIDGIIKTEFDDFDLNGVKMGDVFEKKLLGEISLDIGAGYAFIRNDKFTLAAFGVIGVTAATYNYEATFLGETGKITIKSASFDFGADIFANYKIAKGFGVYADLAFKGMAGSTTSSNEIPHTPEAKDVSSSLIGFKFAPTIGASFAF